MLRVLALAATGAAIRSTHQTTTLRLRGGALLEVVALALRVHGPFDPLEERLAPENVQLNAQKQVQQNQRVHGAHHARERNDLSEESEDF